MHTYYSATSMKSETKYRSSSARLFRAFSAIAMIATVGVSQTVSAASGAVRNQPAVAPAQIPTEGFGSKLVVDSFAKLMTGDLPSCGENGDPAGTYTMDLGFRVDTEAAIRRGVASMVKFEIREGVNGVSAGYLYLDVKPRLTFDIDASSCLYEKTFEVRSKSFPVTVLIFGVPTVVDVNIGMSLDLSLNVDAPLTMRASIGGGIQRGVLLSNGQVQPCGKSSRLGCEARFALTAVEFDPVTGQSTTVVYPARQQARADRPELALTIEEGLKMAPVSKVSFTAQLRLETQFLINGLAGPAMYGRAGVRADIVACPNPKIDQRAYQLSRIWGGGVKAVASDTAAKLYEEIQKANPWLTRLIASAREVVKASFKEFLPSLEYDWPGEDALLFQAAAEFQWPLVSCSTTDTQPPKIGTPPEVKPPAAKPPAVKPPTTPVTPPPGRTPPVAPPRTPVSPAPPSPPNSPSNAMITDTIAGCADDETGALRLRTSVSQSCGPTSSTVVWHVARRIAVPTGRSAQRLQVCVGSGGILSVPTGVFSSVSVLTCPSGSPARLWTLVGAAPQEAFQSGIELVCASTIQMRIADSCAPSETTLRFNTDGPRSV
jgi:hypothetical protein